MTDTPALRKARGAFFTPPEMSDFIASWAIRSPGDRVLEPSCGEASFLLAAGRRLRALGASRAELHGVELHEASARGAREVIESHAFAAGITVADFFDVPPAPMYDAAIGNPPYVRYQHFTGLARAKGLQAALAQGVRLTGLASAWAAFVIHAAQFLKPSGRLGLVLPAELLTVNYAAQVRHFLLNRFASVRLVMFDELVFPGVLEEVVLLLAEGTGGAAKFELFHARDLADLRRIDRDVWTDYAPDGEGKWTPALLSTEAVETYHVIAQEEGFSPLLEWGDTYLGAVTGNNRYFTLTQAQAIEHGFWRSELLRISPPGSRHLRGLTFSDKAWAEQAQSGARCYLFAPMIGADVSPAAERHIESGEAAGVNAAYKCRMRKPWWRVPIVKVPDLLLTYMDHDRPRLTTNEARAYHLNSLYGVSLRPGRRELGRDLLPLACLNSLTLLGAEMVGRAYGGGLLKLEPKEADKLPVPSLALLEKAADALRALRPQLYKALRNGDLMSAVKRVDRVLLTGQLGLPFDAIRALREAREALFTRRVTRAKGGRGEN